MFFENIGLVYPKMMNFAIATIDKIGYTIKIVTIIVSEDG